MPPTTEQSVTITEWLYDPRGLDRYALDDARPFAEATHADFPDLRVRLEYDQDLRLRSASLSSVTDVALTARILRDFPYGSVDSAARAHMAWWWREYDESRPDAARQVAPIPKKALEAIDIRRPGRRGRPDLEYADLAREYVELVASEPAKPLEALAERRYLSPSQVRNLLYESRRRGILTAAPPGRPGGMLTAKAMKLLGKKSSPFPQWTDDQLAAARQRDEPTKRLWEQLQAGEISGTEWSEQIEPLMREAFKDEEG